MSEFKLGNSGNINLNSIKGGIKKKEFVQDNKNLEAIFNAVDANKDGVLDEGEIKNLKEQIIKHAGDDSKLSEKEAGNYLKEAKLQNLDKKDLLNFIELLSQSGENIKESTYTEDANGNKTIHITYNDDSVETLNPDQTSEIATKGENGETIVKKFDNNKKLTSTEITNEDGSKETTKYDKNGIPTETVIEKKDGSKTTRTYNDNGEPLQEITVGKGGNPVETVTFSGEGRAVPTAKTVKNGTTVEEFTYDKDGNPVLTTKKENEGIPAKEKITTYTQNEDGTITATIKEYGKETVQTIKDNKVLSETITDNNSKKYTERTFTEDGYTDVVLENGNTYETTFNNENKRLSQSKTLTNGKTYEISYDGKGNTTGIIVQNGESIEALAKKFNCTPQEIIDANPDAVKGSGNKKYFLVGTEIKIPKELEADDKALQGRKSKEESVQGYTNYMAAKAAEEAAAAEEEESKKAEEAQKAATEELKAKQNEAAKVANGLYTALPSKRLRAVDHKDFQNALKKVTSDNASMVISQYNAQHPEKSLVGLICSEKTSSNEARKEALKHIMNALADEARAKGVPEADVKKYYNEFIISMNAEFKKFGVIDPKKMEVTMKALHGLVLSKDVNAAELTDAEAKESITGSADEQYESAKGQFDKAREEEGWAAKTGDTVLGWFGYITKEDMEGKLSAYKGDIEKLQNCKSEAEFRQVYEDVFGIPYDKKKIEAYEGAKTELTYASGFKSKADTLQNLYSEARGLDYETYKAKVAEALPELDAGQIDEIVNSMSEEYMRNYPHSDKKDVLRYFIDQYKQQQLQMFDEVSKGRTLEQMNSEIDAIRQSAFGTKDIVNDVVKYNENQELTGMAVEMVGEIAATAALQAIPGLGQAAAARLAVSAARWGSRGVKMLNYAQKAGGAFKKINTAMNSTKAARIGSNVGSAFVGTAAVDYSNGKSVKEALKKGLQNATFAGAGAFSTEMAQILSKTYGISNKVAKEIAEEITERTLDVMTSAGVSVAMIGEYTSTDAFMDIATGVIMGRLGKTGLKKQNADPNAHTSTKADAAAQTPKAPETPTAQKAKDNPQVEQKNTPAPEVKHSPETKPEENIPAERAEVTDKSSQSAGNQKSELSEFAQKLSDKIKAIKDAEIPQQYKDLWANCKQEFSNLASKLPSGEEMLAKCKSLYSNIKQIANSATGAVKAQLDELLENIKSMAQKAKASIKASSSQSGFKPVKSRAEAEQLYEKLVGDYTIGNEKASSNLSFWNRGGEPWMYTLYGNQKAQGTPWKMHLYANSPEEWANVAKLAMPYLTKNEIEFKTMLNLSDEEFDAIRNTLNSEGQASQTGKAFTIYFENEEQFVKTAKALEEIFEKSGLKSSGKAMNEAQIGESGFLSYRHEGAERGVQYKPDDIEDPYLNSLKNNTDGTGSPKPKTDDDIPLVETTPVDETSLHGDIDEIVEITPKLSEAEVNSVMAKIQEGMSGPKTVAQINKMQEMLDSLPPSPQKTALQKQFDNYVENIDLPDMQKVELQHKNNVSRIKDCMPDENDGFVSYLADLIEWKPEISDKLMDLVTNSNRYGYDISHLIEMANENNIDDLIKLSKNKSLRCNCDKNGRLIKNDFDLTLKVANSVPEFKNQILDVASNSGRPNTDIYHISQLMKKYPDQADVIAQLTTSNKHIKVSYDLNNVLADDIDTVMNTIKAHPEMKDDIINYMSVQRKGPQDTTSSVESLGNYVRTIEKYPEFRQQINTLSKDPNIDGASIHFIINEYRNSPQQLNDAITLASKGYTHSNIIRKMDAMQANPKLKEAYLSDSPEFTLIDKNPSNTPSATIEKRFATRDKLETEFSTELQTLKNTLGDEFYTKVQWEEIIPPNASSSDIKAILDDLNDSSKFFARTTINEENYGKNIKWASEMNQISNAATVRITDGESFDDVIKQLAMDYRGYDEATTLGSNVNPSDRREYSGLYRGRNNDGGATTPFDNGGSYQEYYDRFSQMLENANNGIKRPKPYPDVELTNFIYCKRGDCMFHPPSKTVEPAMKHIGERYDELKPLVEKVKNGGTLTDAEIAMAHDKISEMYYIMGNVMPWARGSNGISDIFMRSMYKSLGIDQPALKKGVSLDLEAFCVPMDEYKANWNNFFEEPVSAPRTVKAKAGNADDAIITPTKAEEPEVYYVDADDVQPVHADEPEVYYVDADEIQPLRAEDALYELEEVIAEPYLYDPIEGFQRMDDEIKELANKTKKEKTEAKKKLISEVKDLAIEHGSDGARHLIENSNLSPETKAYLNEILDGIEDVNDLYNISNAIADGDYEDAMQGFTEFADEHDMFNNPTDDSLPFDDNMIL